jgi:hypothetical protein
LDQVGCVVGQCTIEVSVRGRPAQVQHYEVFEHSADQRGLADAAGQHRRSGVSRPYPVGYRPPVREPVDQVPV